MRGTKVFLHYFYQCSTDWTLSSKFAKVLLEFRNGFLLCLEDTKILKIAYKALRDLTPAYFSFHFLPLSYSSLVGFF